MPNTTLKMTVIALVGLAIGVGDVHADGAQLEEKLRHDLAVTLEDVTITQALEQIGQKAGVKIVLSPEAAGRLPEDEQTRLSVTLEGRLAESLEKMLNNFFLRYAVGSESLTIYPRPELKRVIGRPTAAELNLLRKIYGNPIWVSTSARGLQDGFAQKVLNMMAGEPVDIMPPDETNAVAAVLYKMMTKSSGSPHDPNASKQDPEAPRGATGAPLTIASILEGIEQFYNNQKTWYIQGPAFPRQVSTIRIVGRQEYWQAHLDQVIDVSFTDEKGESVVRTLGEWAGLDVRIADGRTAQALAREITLEVQNVKLLDALDRVVSVLSVRREIKDWDLRLDYDGPQEPVNEPPRQVAGESQAAGYVGKISIPMDGGRYFIEFMLRESDLSEEMRKLRQQVMIDIIAKLSREGKMEELLKQLSSEPGQK